MNGDPYRYSHSVEQAIQIRFQPNNINRDSGIDIARAWTPTIRQHNCQSVSGQTAEGTVYSSYNENNASDLNPPTMTEIRNTLSTNNHDGTNSPTE